MKNYLNLSTIVLQVFSILALLLGAVFLLSTTSCNKFKGKDSKMVANQLNEEKFHELEDKKNAAFLVEAAEIHMNEMYLAQLVQQEGKQIDVKELGKLIEKINSNALNNLTGLANKKSISIPTSTTLQGLEALKFLNKKSGIEFDKEYCDMIVASQKRSILLFEEIVDQSNDPEIKILAFCTLPNLRKHLDYAFICQKKCDAI